MVEQVTDIEKYLRKIDHIIRKEGRLILNDFNITVPQFTALQILINDGNMTIGKLSQKTALAYSTITDLIDRMEKSELVIRKKDDKDKRVVRIEVLPKGFEILEKVLERRREFLKSKLNDFSTEEKEMLNKVLRRLYDVMNQ
ncbi:MarR family winged helix-turn-helix transcriptional regulator [Paratissierella segnis]|jgi:DNA-binding MarR family transcriptional regulator|uniref:MarR family transcriptional regulator n=1 Tax=Paratissierella segnis TaxID=2763679 RepID=A0A926ILK7_9FIRM|nr:MarR family transcriptional regulator [Paratissierella segnis]MBC8588763.1 MarR family transcriptional regulator [Paratissierella segnis]